MKKDVFRLFLLITIILSTILIGQTARPEVNNATLSARNIKAGDQVYVRPLNVLADSTFTTPTEVALRNQLSQYEKSEFHETMANINDMRPSRIRMTWIEYDELLRRYAQENNMPLNNEESKNRVAAKMYQLTGVRPLRHGQILVSLPNIYESIYHIKDLGFTKNIYTDFFRIGEQVIFPQKLKGSTVYSHGRVVAILLNGELIVEKGLSAEKFKARDIFSTERSYKHNRFKLYEMALYRFVTSDHLPAMVEPVDIRGFTPKGDIAIYLRKTREILKIPAEEVDGLKTKVIQKYSFCPKLFR